MSQVKVSGNASGTGVFEIAAPNSNNNYTLTLPTATTTLVGTDATQTLTNKTLTSPAISGAVMSSMGSSVITSGTAVASTSGTSINFTGIPSWVKRITVMFNGVSTSGTSPFLVQIGSGAITTTGYQSGSGGASTSSNTTVGTNATTGFVVHNFYAAGANSGIVTLALVGSNTWVESHSTYTVGGALPFMFTGGGNSSALGGTLDRIRITTVNGTDTFDAGSINILYE